jgi:SAM-dependent methyltransferase
MISHARASAIAHGDLPFHNPISVASIDAVLDLLVLARDDDVLDIGCGPGELLVRIAERSGTGGVGIDTSEEQIAVARAHAAARAPAAALAFEAGDAGAYEAPAATFALGACLGATHALGGLDGTLDRLAELVRPGGYSLVGEGYWAHRPERELLALLGATEDELTGLPELLAAGDARGLELVYAATASPREWELYEWAYVFNADRYAAEHSDEAGIELIRDRAATMRRRRQLAARDGETLGFALVVWRLRPF